MGLLAIPVSKRPESENFKKFTDEARWKELEKLFLDEHQKLFSQSLTPMITSAL
jgi:hypothetical protein